MPVFYKFFQKIEEGKQFSTSFLIQNPDKDITRKRGFILGKKKFTPNERSEIEERMVNK